MSDRVAEKVWLGGMTFWRRYFRYEVEGLEHLATPECRLVVGYHGRPLAWDLFLLGAAVHAEQGYLPLAVVHRIFFQTGALRWLADGLDWTTGRGPVLDEAVRLGRHIILAPGGQREGLRTAAVRYRVDWSDHLGYLRFALSRGLKVVPVGASGVDDTYHGAMGGDIAGVPAWLGLGPFGPYPLSVPFPVHIHQLIGEPIDLTADGPVDPRDEEHLRELHRRVQAQVQGLIDAARARHAPCCQRRIRRLLSP